jgi:predicted acetyltransferase
MDSMTVGPGILATNKCGHRFMWVDLQIKHLCAMKIGYEVEEELGKLPSDLATTYEQIYKKIPDDGHLAPLALKALMWILGAEEPLSPEEWTGGVSWALPRPDRKSPKLETPVLLDVCQNLVVNDGQQNVMRFAHLSVREFLEAEALDRQAAEMAASACLAILQHPHTLNAQPTDFTPFHGYSIRHWPEQVRRCDDNDPTPQLSSTLSAFMGSFVRPADAYIHWFKAASGCVGYKDRLKSTPPNPLLAAAYFGFKKVCSHLWEENTYDPNFTKDAKETLLYLASSQGHIPTVRLLLQNGANVNDVTHRGKKALLLVAIEGRHSKVLDLLLDAGAIFNRTKYGSIVLAGASVGNRAVMELLLQRDATIEITEAIVNAAAGNWRSGKEVMELLLLRDATIEISEAIVTTVARNSRKEVMELLLQRDATIEISEAVVTAAAGNWRSGKEVMELLLQRDATIEITEPIVTAAAGNRGSGKEVIELLLQRDATIEITEAIVTVAAREWGKKVMELLLQRDDSIEITEAIVTAAAGNQRSWKEVMKLLLQRGASIEAIVIAAATDGRSGKEVMELLLQRDATIEITEAIVTAVARNWGKEVMELLLQRDATIEITEAIVTAAAGNLISGKEVMKLLLQRDATIEITEAIVTAAAENLQSGEEVMELLLQRNAAIEITEAIVTAAAGNGGCGKEVMELLLQRDATIEITEAIVTAAAGNLFRGEEVMELLLQIDATIEITEAIVTAAAANTTSGKEVIELVLELVLQRDASIEITEAIVTAAAGNRSHGKKAMTLLLQTGCTFATKSSLIAAAFFAQPHWFESLCSKIDSNSLFAQNDMQCLIAAIEGGNTSILDACLGSSHGSGDTDDHGWTLHMVAMQSRNQKAIEKLQDASEEFMQPMSFTRWEVNPIISPFVSLGGDGTSLVYSGNLPGFSAEFQALTINRWFPCLWIIGERKSSISSRKHGSKLL